MRILWLHWRDICNPDGGGAEVLSHEISKRLVKKGHSITQFCSEYPQCEKEQVIDGVKIVRSGQKYSVYNHAKKYYKQNLESFDLIIDEINTRPFLTPDFVEKPIVALIHQLAREFWFYETKFPINIIGFYILEKYWLRKYRNIPTITVSNSTYDDLKKLHFNNVKIMPEGISRSPLEKIPSKEKTPTLIYIARLKKAKLPEDAIKSFKIIQKKIRDAQLWVVGSGYMRKKLELIAENSKSIKFWGKISEEDKFNLLSKAHLILIPAVREGWGLIVIEANASGTPAVAYNVPGLKDSVKNGVTGILTDNNIFSLAEETIKLLNDQQKLVELQNNSLTYARQFDWNKSADIFEDYLKDFSSSN